MRYNEIHIRISVRKLDHIGYFIRVHKNKTFQFIGKTEYSIAVFRFKDKERSLKIAFMINMLMYSVFSVVIQNYVGAAANLFVAATTLISLIREGPAHDS